MSPACCSCRGILINKGEIHHTSYPSALQTPQKQTFALPQEGDSPFLRTALANNWHPAPQSTGYQNNDVAKNLCLHAGLMGGENKIIFTSDPPFTWPDCPSPTAGPAAGTSPLMSLLCQWAIPAPSIHPFLNFFDSPSMKETIFEVNIPEMWRFYSAHLLCQNTSLFVV